MAAYTADRLSNLKSWRLYLNIDYKYQYQKQTSENKTEFECGDPENSNIKKLFEIKHKILERDFDSK